MFPHASRMSLDMGPPGLGLGSWARPLTRHVALDKCTNLTEPQFSYLQNGDN